MNRTAGRKRMGFRESNRRSEEDGFEMNNRTAGRKRMGFRGIEGGFWEIEVEELEVGVSDGENF